MSEYIAQLKKTTREGEGVVFFLVNGIHQVIIGVMKLTLIPTVIGTKTMTKKVVKAT
jgi:uncharacterized membrane protein YuzA (DUF378 family)